MSMFVLAAALAIAAAPSPTPSPTPIAPAQLNASQNIDPKTDTRRVCLVDKFTGSNIPSKICKTRARWIAEGADPLAKN